MNYQCRIQNKHVVDTELWLNAQDAKYSGFWRNQKCLNLLEYIFPTNLKNWNFIAGIERYGQLNILNSQYRIVMALKNRNFANDLRFRRNHFCWVREVKLLLGFKFHNFLNQYVTVAQLNVFCQFRSTRKWPFFKRSRNSMKSVLLGPYRRYEARKYFSGIFRVRMWPR